LPHNLISLKQNTSHFTTSTAAVTTTTTTTNNNNNNNMDNKNLLPKEQKGCSSSRTKGCKDQLLISKVILQECKSRIKV